MEPPASDRPAPETLVTAPPRSYHQRFVFSPFDPPSNRMRHVLSALVQNVPGVLAHVAGMFASRGYNIDSLAVGETENPELSRMTFVVVGDDSVLAQVRKQLEKIVTVVRVEDISSQEFVERDLMLIKVQASAANRAQILELCSIFRGKVVDVAPDQVIVEISGQEKKIEAFIDLMRPFGIAELARTGRIALVRGIEKPNGEGSSLRRVTAAGA
jgi:acetolactate synthase-1/3 small subunit